MLSNEEAFALEQFTIQKNHAFIGVVGWFHMNVSPKANEDKLTNNKPSLSIFSIILE
jgi:hypothetical protein